MQVQIGLPIFYGVKATIDGHPAFNRNIRVGALPTGSTNLNGVEEEQQTHFPVTEKIVGAAPIYLAILIGI